MVKRLFILELSLTDVAKKEIQILYKMNELAKIQVKTLFGKTGEFIVKEIVWQGTIWGPVLCANSTDKVNLIGERAMYVNGNNNYTTNQNNKCA